MPSQEERRALQGSQEEVVRTLNRYTSVLIDDADAAFSAGTDLQVALREYGDRVVETTGWSGIVDAIAPVTNDEEEEPELAAEPGNLVRVRIRWDLEVFGLPENELSEPTLALRSEAEPNRLDSVSDWLMREYIDKMEHTQVPGLSSKGIFYVIDVIDRPLGASEPNEEVFRD